MEKKRKIIITLFITVVVVNIMGIFYQIQASNIDPASIAERLESTNRIAEEQQKVSKHQATTNLIVTGVSFVVSIGYIVFLLLYTSKLGTKINEPKGLLYLSLLIPLVGLILYCVYIKKNEKLGKACGKLAILGITMPMIFSGILSIGALINNANNGIIT